MVIEPDRPDPRLAERLASLGDRPPEVDLWPGIARRIAKRPIRRGVLELRWPMALAAGLALIAGGAALTTLLQQRTSRGPAPAAVAAAPLGDAAIRPAGFTAANSSLTEAITRVEEAVSTSSSDLTPEARERIRRSLLALDAAITDARVRADAAPDDITAARYLTRTMQRKLSALQRIASMTTQS